MKIVFRADASAEIGIGHVMRCLTLADELARLGGVCLFLCRELRGHMAGTIRDRGHKALLLPDTDDLAEDAAFTRQAVEREGGTDWLVTDHYGIARDWEEAVAAVSRRICVIGGPADREHLCDILHDQNYFRDHEAMWRPLVPAAADLLLGPRFALLQPEFLEARKRRGMEGRNRVLVTFGGGDVPNATELTLRALALAGFDGGADVAVGGANPHLAALEKVASRMGNVRLHVSPRDMASLMAEADFAICGGGVTLFEGLCIGMPSLVVSIAANQSLAVRLLAEDGYARFAGEARSLTVELLAERIAAFAGADAERRAMAAKGMELVDGRGAARVAERLLGWREAGA